MASGKKNYFRHSFNAFEDDKIQTAIDKLGYQGYAYYFILLELLAKQCEHEVKNPIRIHQQSLRNVWRKQSKSCIKVVKKLQESGLFVATFNESFIEFDIPNLAKYLGKYTNKMSPNTPNKRKENKRKEKERKSPYNPPVGGMEYTPDDLVQLWNETMPVKTFKKTITINSTNHMSNFFIVIENVKSLSDWSGIFNKCISSKYLSGKTSNGFIVNLTWLLDWNNTVKVLNGNYDNKNRGLTEEDIL